jgi:hypothetical protein
VSDLPPTSTASRDFTTAWAGRRANGNIALHVVAKSAARLDYYVHDGVRWVGPIALTTFTNAQAANFVVRDASGCSAGAPVLVGSADEGGRRRGIILTPKERPFE